jgi:hypothetical protein
MRELDDLDAFALLKTPVENVSSQPELTKSRQKCPETGQPVKISRFASPRTVQTLLIKCLVERQLESENNMNKNESVLVSVCSKLRLGPIFLVAIVSIGIISFLVVVQARANQGASAGALKAVSGMNQEMATMYKTAQDQAKGAGMKLPDAPNFDLTGANRH